MKRKAPAGLLAILLYVPAAAAAPAEVEILRVFSEIDAITRSESAEGSQASRGRVQKIAAFKPAVLRWHEEAVAPLILIASDGSRPLLSRVWALSFAAETRDPSAFAPLKSFLQNPSVPEVLRRTAAGDIRKIQVGPNTLQSALCQTLADKDLPPTVFREVLMGLSDLGCPDHAALLAWARRLGPAPRGRDASSALTVVKALGRTPTREAALSLLDLVLYYRKRSTPRVEVLRQLKARQRELEPLRGEALSVLRQALFEESRAEIDSAILALEMLSYLKDADSIMLYIRLLSNPDPRLVTVSAETLSRLGYQKAIPRLEGLLEGLHADARFAPSESVADPRELAARIEKALSSLKAR